MNRQAVGAFVGLLSALLLLTHAAAQDRAQFVDPVAGELFRYSRQAVGVEAVSKLTSLILKGRSRFVGNDGALVRGVVEIKLLLPDRYLRIDRVGDTEKVAAYAGTTVLSAIRANGNVSLPPAELVPKILRNEKLRVARFLLGAVTYVTADHLFTFSSIGRGAALIDPRVSAKRSLSLDNTSVEPLVANVVGDDNFVARFVVDSKSRAPARLVCPGADKNEIVITFEDRRPVDGLKLPFRVTTMTGKSLTDELLFDQILVNPELGKNDFKR